MVKFRILAVLLSIIVFISGCAGGGVKKTTGAFIEGSYGGDAESLNLLLVADGTSFSYIGHTMDSLATSKVSLT